jgi:hypothetical protein
MGMNNQQNQMNAMMMDETFQNLRNIIQPYENRIRELEEIIRHKDFVIDILKQKLNNKNSNINNMNPMNIMMGSMNQQMKNKGQVISLTIISEKKVKLLTVLKLIKLLYYMRNSKMKEQMKEL